RDVIGYLALAALAQSLYTGGKHRHWEVAMFRPAALALVVWQLPFWSLGAAEPDKVRAAVERALPLLQKSATTYTEHRDCFACHHQAAAVLALATARAHGFAIDADVLDQQV